MRCKKCILTDKVRGASFENGVCGFCQNPKTLFDEKQKQACLDDFEKTVGDLQNNPATHNCLVALSGGKDSAYLLYLLKNKYKLRPLAVTVSTGFLSQTALKNISEITRRLSVEHLIIRPEIKFFTPIYRHFLLNPTENPITHDICKFCTALMDFFMLETAFEKNIPIIFTGLSPEQVRPETFNLEKNLFYEMNPQLLLTGDLLKFFKDEMASKMSARMNALKSQTNLPRIIYPLLALPYDLNAIQKTIKENKLIKSKNASTFKTNCLINSLMIWSSIKKQRVNPYLESYSRLIRKNPSMRHKFLRIDQSINLRIKFGFFHNRLINRLLKALELKKEDIVKNSKK